MSKRLLLATAGIVIATMAGATGALAATYRVDVTPTDPGPSPYYFLIDSAPTPDQTSLNPFFFTTPVTEYNLAGGPGEDVSVGFNAPDGGGGFFDKRVSTGGDVLFTYQTDAMDNVIDPVLKLGTFTDDFGGTATVTISEATIAAAPEPASWLLMLFGTGLMGWAVRRARTTFGLSPA